MSAFGQFPQNLPILKTLQGLTDGVSSGKIIPFEPASGASDVEFANFLVDSGVHYRTNRFFATVFPPTLDSALSKLYQRDGKGFRFVCEQSGLPAQSLFTIDYKINNLPLLKLPYTIDYGNELNLTFRMSKEYLERKFFLQWQEFIFDINSGVAYYDEYTNTSSIILSQIDSQNRRVFNTQFIGVYPTNIGAIEYSWDADSNYVKQQVTFSFYRMISEGVVPTSPTVEFTPKGYDLAGTSDETKNPLQKSKDLFNGTTGMA